MQESTCQGECEVDRIHHSPSARILADLDPVQVTAISSQGCIDVTDSAESEIEEMVSGRMNTKVQHEVLWT